MAKQQAIGKAVQSTYDQVRGVQLVRSPSLCKTVGQVGDDERGVPATCPSA
jgi:hypothetical protein